MDHKEYWMANKRTGLLRKGKSLELMQGAVALLNTQQTRPTIMKVAEILKGNLGVATIKKYWRLVNPKLPIVGNSSNDEILRLPQPFIPFEHLHTTEQLKGNPEEENRVWVDVKENYIEHNIREWNYNIYKPKYFKVMHNANDQLAAVLYQRQFNPFIDELDAGLKTLK